MAARMKLSIRQFPAAVILFVSLRLFCASLDAAQHEPDLSASPTPAPAVNADGMAEAERVMVTGSNIPTAAEVGPNPVQVIDRYTIEKSGERNTEELLRDQAVANANGVPTSGNTGAIFGQGAASISLRGFDPGATLVLIDGHRLVSHPSGTSGGAQFFVDLNSIPRAAIDSIEILTDGASSTYGADAVAGVVNIKLRHDFRGAETELEYGNSSNRDSGEMAASLLFGVGNAKFDLTGVASYYSRNSIFNRDRDYDRHTPLARFTTNSSPYNLELDRNAVIAAGGNPDPALGNTFFGHAPFFTHGSSSPADYTYTEGPSASFPINRYQGELPDTQRYGVYLNGDYKIAGQQAVAYADVFFGRADVHNEQAPVNTGSFQLNNATTLAIPPHAPGATLGGPSYSDTGVPLGAYNPFNPFQQIISGDSRARLFEFGDRLFRNRTDTFFSSVGLRGDKLWGSWGYDAAFRYSHVIAPIDFTFPSTTRFNRALNAADPIFDPTSPQYIGTTIPFNPFGDYRIRLPNNYRLVDFVLVHPREIDTGSLAVADLNIYSTQLFSLPAGGVGLALGAQFQNESVRQAPDGLLQRGDLRPFGPLFPVHGNRESYAGYAETRIPLLGGDFVAPGFHALDFTAAARYEAFGERTNVMVPKVGLRWQPFDDSLTIRATWGEGYRLPTLVELVAPPISAAQSVFDPVKKVFVNDVPTVFLPNPNLQPEDSRNFTAGIVYSPKFALGLTVSVDLFDIETTGWVNPLPDPTRTITRIESGNAFPGESVVRDANGNLVSITQVGFENTGTQKARGADFGISYELQTSVGTFRSHTLATYLDSFQFSPFPGQPEQELRSSPTDQFSDDAYLKWKALSQLAWTWHAIDTVLTARYRDGFHEILAFGPTFPNHIKEHWVKQTWFFDWQASYEFGHDHPLQPNEPRLHDGWPTWRVLLDRTQLTIGINNIFNHDPPRSLDNFPRFIYDPTGRFFYASVTKKFW